MSDGLVYLLASCVFALLAFGLPAWLNRRRSHLDRQMAFANQYYSAARNVVGNKEVPDELAELVMVLGRMMFTPRLGRRIMSLWLKGEFSRIAERSRDRQSPFDQISSDAMRREVAVAVVSGMFAATCENHVIGPIVRRNILYWLMGNSGQSGGDATRYATAALRGAPEMSDLQAA